MAGVFKGRSWLKKRPKTVFYLNFKLKNELKHWKGFFNNPASSFCLVNYQKINENFLYHKNLIFITKLIDFSKIYFVLKLQKKLIIQQRNLLRAIISIFQKISPKRSIFGDFLCNIKNSTDSYPPCIITFPSHLWLFIGPFFLHKYVFHSLNILIILAWLRNFSALLWGFSLEENFSCSSNWKTSKNIFFLSCVSS